MTNVRRMHSEESENGLRESNCSNHQHEGGFIPYLLTCVIPYLLSVLNAEKHAGKQMENNPPSQRIPVDLKKVIRAWSGNTNGM